MLVRVESHSDVTRTLLSILEAQWPRLWSHMVGQRRYQRFGLYRKSLMACCNGQREMTSENLEKIQTFSNGFYPVYEKRFGRRSAEHQFPPLPSS
jgi:hypothetical protein